MSNYKSAYVYKKWTYYMLTVFHHIHVVLQWSILANTLYMYMYKHVIACIFSWIICKEGEKLWKFNFWDVNGGGGRIRKILTCICYCFQGRLERLNASFLTLKKKHWRGFLVTDSYLAPCRKRFMSKLCLPWSSPSWRASTAPSLPTARPAPERRTPWAVEAPPPHSTW